MPFMGQPPTLGPAPMIKTLPGASSPMGPFGKENLMGMLGDPAMHFALGLLEQGGPQRMPVSFGQGIARAGLGASQRQDFLQRFNLANELTKQQTSTSKSRETRNLAQAARLKKGKPKDQWVPITEDIRKELANKGVHIPASSLGQYNNATGEIKIDDPPADSTPKEMELFAAASKDPKFAKFLAKWRMMDPIQQMIAAQMGMGGLGLDSEDPFSLNAPEAQDEKALLTEARDAIEKGADPAEVAKVLQDAGIDPRKIDPSRENAIGTIE